MRGAQDIVVAGAGAVGSAIALALARAGHRVVVADPAPLGANASGVAAGMLAPAFEAVFDPLAADHFALLIAARDRWPPFAAETGVVLHRDGAMALGARADVEAWAVRLADLGARKQVLGPSEAAQLTPGLRGDDWAVFSPEDWRLDGAAALAALRAAAGALGVRFIPAGLRGFANGRAEFDAAPPAAVDTLILATGAARDLAGLAPELARLTPVKGHILRAAAGRSGGPVLRSREAYLCRAADGLVLGATMEPGLDDASVDPAVVAALVARGERLAPGLGALDWRAATGVRAATPDGLPMVGASSAPGVVLAVGTRRNGWLLAPLIAEAVAAVVADEATGPAAALFDPGRF